MEGIIVENIKECMVDDLHDREANEVITSDFEEQPLVADLFSLKVKNGSIG